MSDNVELFTGFTPLEFGADVLLDAAKKADLQTAIIVGWTQAGDLFISGTTPDALELNYLLDRAKMEILTQE